MEKKKETQTVDVVSEKFINNKYVQLALRVGMCIFQGFLLFTDPSLKLSEQIIITLLI